MWGWGGGGELKEEHKMNIVGVTRQPPVVSCRLLSRIA